MKKLVFSLVATAFFILTGNAQKMTNEDLRVELATSMSKLVEVVKPNFRKGMTYDDFIKTVILGGTTTTTIPETGNNLLKKTYSYLNNQTTSTQIIKEYDGTEMADVYYLAKDSKTVNETATKVFGEKIVNETQFGQNIVNSQKLACCKWLSDAFNWVWEHREEIIAIICNFSQWC